MGRVTVQSSEREVLAQRIVARLDALTPKLVEFEEDIRLLWAEFESLTRSETIMGCKTKREFCSKYLQRSPRSVQYMLAGGNLSRRKTVASETVSRRPTRQPVERLTLEERRKEIFGDDAPERQMTAMEELRKTLPSDIEVTELDWAPFAATKENDRYGAREDRYKMTVIVSASDFEKIAGAYRLPVGTPMERLFKQAVETIGAGGSEVTKKIRFQRHVQRLAKALNLTEGVEYEQQPIHQAQAAKHA